VGIITGRVFLTFGLDRWVGWRNEKNQNERPRLIMVLFSYSALQSAVTASEVKPVVVRSPGLNEAESSYAGTLAERLSQ